MLPNKTILSSHEKEFVTFIYPLMDTFRDTLNINPSCVICILNVSMWFYGFVLKAKQNGNDSFWGREVGRLSGIKHDRQSP